ncbi:alpha/beta hydrolase, partial [Listeria monocytogenes]|nr:alpha/beta hydrolase [Listeria monocytogenes]
KVLFPSMGHLQAVKDAPEYWPTVLQFIENSKQNTDIV